ncbi:hypothetical protein [Bacillus sp. AK128]
MIWSFLSFLIIIYLVYSLHVIKNQLDDIQRKLGIYEEKYPQLTDEEIEKELIEEIDNGGKSI